MFRLEGPPQRRIDDTDVPTSMTQKVLRDAVEAGQRIGAIFKEPTVTPSALQVLNTGHQRSRTLSHARPLEGFCIL